MRRALLGLLAGLFALPLAADERELASEGSAVRLEIDKGYRCEQDAKVTITTASAAYFDQDAATIQRLSDTSRAILGFECPRIARIEFIGVTGGTPVYLAEAKKANRWRLESYPPPLEGAALLFSLKQPSFRNLGLLAAQVEPYEALPGFLETYQYKAWQAQMRIQASAADGNIEAFRKYLQGAGADLGSFEQAKAHFQYILTSFKGFVPGHYEAYKKVYDELAPTLRQAYWASQFDTILEEDFDVSSVIGNALKLVKSSPSPEFLAFLDSAISEWMRSEADGIKEELSDASLEDLSWSHDYLGSFPQAAVDASKLPKTAALVLSQPKELNPLVEQRLSALQKIAIAAVHEAGDSFSDVNDILEAGFALSSEFEELGYEAQAQSVLTAALQHIDAVLKSGIPAYKQQLRAMKFTAESAGALQDQIAEFDALSEDFPAFAAYKEAALGALEANKKTICASVLAGSGAGKQDEARVVQIGRQSVSLAKMSCDMYSNGHMLVAFKKTGKPGEVQITIREDDGKEVSHVLAQQGHTLVAVSRPDDQPVSPDSWESYALALMRAPANGKADAKGVRECDRLAADPDDLKKLAKGVDFNRADVSPADFDRAIEACVAAVEDVPDDHRQQFQLGRLLSLAGDSAGAKEYLDLAIAGGYAAAMYHKAEHLLLSSSDQNAFVDSLELFAASAKAGYPRGAAMVKELNPDGIEFFRNIPAPTPSEIAPIIPLRSTGVSFLGVSTSLEVVSVLIKECFQINATDFSCEYRPVLRCGFSSGRPDAGMAFMSRLLQASCDFSEYTFNTFRKVSDGRWETLPDQ